MMYCFKRNCMNRRLMCQLKSEKMGGYMLLYIAAHNFYIIENNIFVLHSE